MQLHQLADKPAAKKRRKRVGRGPGSGMGKSCGRGIKGQKSRSGVAIKGFEGGQMPIHRRMPKRGFVNIFASNYSEVNIGALQQAVDAGKIDASKPVTAAEMVASGLARKSSDGVRILGKGKLGIALTIEAAGASKGAVAAIKKAGGKLTIVAQASGKREDKKAKANS